VALRDLNGDGHLDLAVNSTDAVHNYGSPSISVLLGTGTGAFGARTDYATLGRTSSAVLGDLNGDGNLDLTVTDPTVGVEVLLGTGSGAFGSPQIVLGSHPFSVGSTYSIALGDLNNDGNLDLVAANWGWSTVSVQLGTGQGTFSTPTEYRMDADTYTVALGGLNGDGNLDIAAAGPNSGAIAYRLGDGTGTFGDPTAGSPMFGSNWAYTVLINDLNGDGTSDLVSVGDMRGGYMIAPTLQVPPTIYFDPYQQPRFLHEGDAGTAAYVFSVSRFGDQSGYTTVNYTVAGSGATPADADDFGGTFPSGNVTIPPGQYFATFTIFVSGDTVLEPLESFTLSVSNPSNNAILDTYQTYILNDEVTNSRPYLVLPIDDASTPEDALYSLDVAAHFADSDAGDTRTYSLSGPAWLSIDETTGLLSGTPTNTELATHTLTVTATDGAGLSISDTFTLTVTNVNDAPLPWRCRPTQSTRT